MKRYFLQLVLLVFALFGAVNVQAQISSPNALFSTQPIPNTTNFFFSSVALGEIVGTNTMSGATKVVWHQFDTNTNKFSIFIKEELTTTSNLTSLINNSGYQLTCYNSTDSTLFYCWTFEPSITVAPIEVDTIKTDCTSLFLLAKTTTTELFYRNPSNLTTPLPVNYNLVYDWIAIPENKTITKVWNPKIDQPYDTTEYSVKVSNSLGLDTVASSLTTPYIGRGLLPKVDIIPIVDNIPNNLDEVDTIPQIGSAPYTVSFKNLSEGIYDYAEIQIFKNDNTSPERQFEYDINRTHTFVAPGKYNVKIALVRYKADGTEDCFKASEDNIITIPESMLGIPNTFTPNGDGINDEFRVSYISLKSYSIYIYNRWGRVVYQSDNPGDGWDGSGMATGVYIYQIEAVGTDGMEYSEHGNLHLLTDQ